MLGFRSDYSMRQACAKFYGMFVAHLRLQPDAAPIGNNIRLADQKPSTRLGVNIFSGVSLGPKNISFFLLFFFDFSMQKTSDVLEFFVFVELPPRRMTRGEGK